jgi:ABC-type multidrug transport system fused ATPase/permease subunit
MRNLILMLFVFTLCSCGARKSQTNTLETKEKSATEKTITDNGKTTTNLDNNIKTTITTETNEKTGTDVETITDEPIDNKLPAFVVDEKGNKTELNNTKRTKTKQRILSDKKNQSISNIVESKTVAKIEQKQRLERDKSTNDKQSKAKTKEIDKEALFSWWNWLLIILVISAVIRFFYCLKTKTPFL